MQKPASLRDVQPGRHKDCGTADHSQGQGQDPGLKGPSIGAPKPHRLLKLTRHEKRRQGLWSVHILPVTQEVGTEDHEFQVFLHYIDFEASLGYIGHCSQ